MKTLKHVVLAVVIPLVISYQSVCFSTIEKNSLKFGGSVSYLQAGDDSYYFRTVSTIDDNDHYVNYHNNPDYKLGL